MTIDWGEIAGQQEHEIVNLKKELATAYKVQREMADGLADIAVGKMNTKEAMRCWAHALAITDAVERRGDHD